MNKNNKNIEDNYNDDELDQFFKNASTPFKNSKEDMWAKMEAKISETPINQNEEDSTTAKVVALSNFKWIAAAAAVIFVVSVTFLRFYTTTISSPNASHITHVLPDGSNIELNAASSISYHPYWWNFNRTVNFEGEAFFDVAKGEKFKIISTKGQTEILGTSFNIFAREDTYKVFCKTGKVKVSNLKNQQSQIITPGEMATFDEETPNGKVIKTDNNILAWKNNKFVFNSVGLTDVLKEVERQFDVNIKLELKKPNEYLYSGGFNKTSSIESTLNIICKSLNLSFKKSDGGSYIVEEK